jgi:hypothetical protein
MSETKALRDSVASAAASNAVRAEADALAARREVFKKIEDEVNRVLGATAETGAGISNMVGRQSQRILNATEPVRDEVLRVLSRNPRPAGNSELVGYQQSAAGQRAIDLGVASLKSNRVDEALLYFINGMNHDPSRVEIARLLADAARKSLDPELVERAAGVLELSTMQVSPDDMSSVFQLVSSLQSQSAPIPRQKILPDEAINRVEQLCSTNSPSKHWSDVQRISQVILDLEELQQAIEVSRIGVDDERYDRSLRLTDEFAGQLQNISSAMPLWNHITVCVGQLELVAEEKQPDRALFASISGSTQGALSQLWAVLDSLPATMQTQLKAFPKRIAAAEAKFQDRVSAEPHRRAMTVLKAARSNETGDHTSRIKRLIDTLEVVSVEADAIVSPRLRAELFGAIRETRRVLSDLELDRREAYQEWALQKLKWFFDEWNKEKVQTDYDAKRLFQRYGIAEIDELLLVPEVARILNRAMSAVTGELNATDASAIEYSMASTDKRALEDF